MMCMVERERGGVIWHEVEGWVCGMGVWSVMVFILYRWRKIRWCVLNCWTQKNLLKIMEGMR